MSKMISKKEIRKFINTITHDDHGSFYHTFKCQGDKTSFNAFTKSELVDELAKDPGYNSYVTYNGFSSSNWRTSKYTREINGIFLDLDDHSHSNKNTSTKIVQTLMLLEDAYSNNEIPRPTMIVNSGRGIHVYYIYDKSISMFCKDGSKNDKLINGHTRFQKLIFDKYRSLLEPHKHLLSLDEKTKDLSRVVRVPGTWNTKSNSMAKIYMADGPYLQLESYCEYDPSIVLLNLEEIKNLNEQKKIKKRAKVFSHSDFTPINRCRMNFCEKFIQAHGGACDGFRHVLILVYLNAALQMMEKSSAKALALSLNEMFVDDSGAPHPLKESEIKSTIRCILNAKDGFYKMSNAYICDQLSISIDKYAKYAYENKEVKKERKSRVLAKDKTLLRKETRNNSIIQFHLDGLTYREISEKIGCSVRTVATVIGKHKKDAKNCT